MPDFTYATDDLFAHFYPENEQARKVWNETFAQQNNILLAQLPTTLAQLRKAGYKVHKAKKVNTSTKDLLDQLMN